jgi:hypothetical protein
MVVRDMAEAIRFSFSEKNLAIFLVLLFVYHVACIFQPHFGLFYDEAYYAHWAEDFAFGYYSKPPVVAWVIGVTSALFGDSDLAVKVGSPILYTAGSWLVYLLAKKCTSPPAAILSSVIFSSTLIVGFNSLFITTDAPLIFFWVLASYLFLMCLEHDKLYLWLALGGVIGLGMLSKYTFAMLPLGLVVFVLIQKKYALFVQPKVWAGGLVSIGLFSLNLYWNSQNAFISFSHTEEIAQLDNAGFKFQELLVFLLSQVLIFGLFVLALSLIRLARFWKKEHYANAFVWQYLACIGLPILILVAAQSFFARAYVNWAGPFVIPLSIACGMILHKVKAKYWCSALAFNHILLVLFFHWPFVLAGIGVEQKKTNSPYHRLSGWEQLTEQVEARLHSHSHPEMLSIVSVDRDVLAYVGHYAGYSVKDLFFWNSNRANIRNHYDLVNPLDGLAQDKSFFVSRSPISEEVAKSFSYVQTLGEVVYEVSPHIRRVVHIYEVGKFNGYSH